MSYENIKVIAYSDYRGDESPRAFFINDEKILVSPHKMSISPRIELPANFDNRVIELERNAPDLRLLCLLQWEPNRLKYFGFCV